MNYLTPIIVTAIMALQITYLNAAPLLIAGY